MVKNESFVRVVVEAGRQHFEASVFALAMHYERTVRVRYGERRILLSLPADEPEDLVTQKA